VQRRQSEARPQRRRRSPQGRYGFEGIIALGLKFAVIGLAKLGPPLRLGARQREFLKLDPAGLERSIKVSTLKRPFARDIAAFEASVGHP